MQPLWIGESRPWQPTAINITRRDNQPSCDIQIEAHNTTDDQPYWNIKPDSGHSCSANDKFTENTNGKEMLQTHHRNAIHKSKCGKLYRTNDLVSSINKLVGKNGWERNYILKGTKYNNQFNLWNLFQFDWSKTVKKIKRSEHWLSHHDFKKNFSCGWSWYYTSVLHKRVIL